MALAGERGAQCADARAEGATHPLRPPHSRGHVDRAQHDVGGRMNPLRVQPRCTRQTSQQLVRATPPHMHVHPLTRTNMPAQATAQRRGQPAGCTPCHPRKTSRTHEVGAPSQILAPQMCRVSSSRSNCAASAHPVCSSCQMRWPCLHARRRLKLRWECELNGLSRSYPHVPRNAWRPPS